MRTPIVMAGTALAVMGAFPYLGADTYTMTSDALVASPQAGAPTTLADPLQGVHPGFSASFAVTVENQSDSPHNDVLLNVTTDDPTPLVTDERGMQVAVERCSEPWAILSNGSYSCAPGSEQTLAPTPAVGNHRLPGSPAAGARGTDHLLVTVSLPDDAPASTMGAGGHLSYQFAAR